MSKPRHGVRRRTAINGQFAPRLIDMLRSPAYRALSLAAHRLLARLEIELAEHGGTDNGKLPTTFDDFEQYGIHRHSIAPAIREVVALGFVEITLRGRAGNADWRRPHVFRLTYRATDRSDPTDEWKRIETDNDAYRLAQIARHSAETAPLTRARRSPQKQKPSGGFRTAAVVAETAPLVSAEATTTGRSAETTTTLDISGGGNTHQRQPRASEPSASVAQRAANDARARMTAEVIRVAAASVTSETAP